MFPCHRWWAWGVDSSAGMMDEKIFQRQITKQALADNFMVRIPLSLSCIGSSVLRYVYRDLTDDRTTKDRKGIHLRWKSCEIFSRFRILSAEPTNSSTVPAPAPASWLTKTNSLPKSTIPMTQKWDSSPHLNSNPKIPKRSPYF